MIWRFGHLMKLDTSSFSVKWQSAELHFCHLTSFAEETKETNFSVKSSWKVHWIVMFQKDAVCIRGVPVLIFCMHRWYTACNIFITIIVYIFCETVVRIIFLHPSANWIRLFLCITWYAYFFLFPWILYCHYWIWFSNQSPYLQYINSKCIHLPIQGIFA